MTHSTRCLLAAALLGFLLPAPAPAANVSVGISVNIPPPALPVYVQPPCPAVGYIWTPGYWAWGGAGYYWVPGVWVRPPAVGLLWTPGYWGWSGGAYIWHAGYWGPHVGFYGGINYGFGYGGVGFVGGEWRGGTFFYNRSVTNVTHITNVHVYNRTVGNFGVSRVSFHGGVGGIQARPSPGELSAGREHHWAFTSLQRQHERAAFHPVSPAVSHGGRPGSSFAAQPWSGGHSPINARAGFGGVGRSSAFTHPGFNGPSHGGQPFHPGVRGPAPMMQSPHGGGFAGAPRGGFGPHGGGPRPGPGYHGEGGHPGPHGRH